MVGGGNGKQFDEFIAALLHKGNVAVIKGQTLEKETGALLDAPIFGKARHGSQDAVKDGWQDPLHGSFRDIHHHVVVGRKGFIQDRRRVVIGLHGQQQGHLTSVLPETLLVDRFGRQVLDTNHCLLLNKSIVQMTQ